MLSVLIERGNKLITTEDKLLQYGNREDSVDSSQKNNKITRVAFHQTLSLSTTLYEEHPTTIVPTIANISFQEKEIFIKLRSQRKDKHFGMDSYRVIGLHVLKVHELMMELIEQLQKERFDSLDELLKNRVLEKTCFLPLDSLPSGSGIQCKIQIIPQSNNLSGKCFNLDFFCFLFFN